jgi:hypothetical protein
VPMLGQAPSHVRPRRYAPRQHAGVWTSRMDFLSSSSQALMNTNRPLMSTVRGTRWPDLCQSLAASLSRKLFGRMSGQFCSM